MIKKFQYYLDENLVKKKPSNKEEAKSLINKSMKRLEYLKSQQINELTAPFIFENIYEAMREASQALMSLRGYKPYSHEALISFLKEHYQFSRYFLSSFDRYRILRNKSVYNAAKISTITCKDALGFLNKYLPRIKKEFDKEIKES